MATSKQLAQRIKQAKTKLKRLETEASITKKKLILLNTQLNKAKSNEANKKSKKVTKGRRREKR